MGNINNVVGFGKIIFIPTHESIPSLPEMSLLLFKEEERGEIFPYRAVCIDLEMDACGNSQQEAWNNLRDSLTMYIDMEKKAADGSITKAAKIITQAAFDDSNQKKAYIAVYRQAKREYTMQNLESGNTLNPIQERKDRLKKLEAGNEPIQSIINDLGAA